MMPRDKCFQMLAELRGEAIVVATYTSAFEWRRAQPHPLNFYAVGAMGQASSQGLGLALGLPDEKIIVLDGDGSLLMNLPSLVTIAGAAPKNLIHFVVQNNCYEANGSHPLPDDGKADFAALARGAGYPHVFEFDGLNRFAAELPELLACPGPVFAALKVVAADPPPQDYEFIHGAEARATFRAAIQPMIDRRDRRDRGA